MRKVRPRDVRKGFAATVAARLAHFDRIEQALRGTAHEKKDLSLLAETTLHAGYVAFEVFVSDLVLAYLNRDFSQYQADLRRRVTQSVEGKFGVWAAGQVSVATRRHIPLTQLENILDPASYNLTFKNVDKLKEKTQEWLVPQHRTGIVGLVNADARLIDTVHAVRNFIAHRSKNAKDIMNQQLANVVTGANCPNINLGRGPREVHEIGSFLKSKFGGERRVTGYLRRLSAISGAL